MRFGGMANFTRLFTGSLFTKTEKIRSSTKRISSKMLNGGGPESARNEKFMKSLSIVAALIFTVPSFGQATKPVTPPAKHEAAVPQKPSELQTAHIDLAIKDFQLAQMRADQAQQAAVNARGAALQMIAAVKAELNLDETWDYDDQREVFVKKHAPIEPAKPASK